VPPAPVARLNRVRPYVPALRQRSAARIAAAQAGLPLVYAPLEGILSKWFGQAEQQLAALFDACAALGRCVVFVDELDALAGCARAQLSVLEARLEEAVAKAQKLAAEAA
jgi:AAA+ superfamily predicted ATPase